MAISDYISQSINAAPDLAQYPDLALAAAQSQNPGQSAQVISQSGKAAAVTQAVQQHHHGLWDDIKQVGGDVLGYLGKPLADVQHDYRYIHDLWTKSDPISATLATLGVVGGATAGAFLGGTAGAALGADAVMAGEAHLAGAGAFDFISPEYQKIYEDSKDEKISPGRDFANLVGLHNTDHGWGKFVSGAADATFDYNADPLAKIGMLAGKGRVAREGLTTSYAARNVPAVRNFLLDHGYGGLGLENSTDKAGNVIIDAVDRINSARNNPQYERALTQIASTVKDKGVGAFISQYPQYARLAPLLANARTADDVHDVFLGIANSSALMHGYKVLPSRTILRSVGSSSIQRLKTVGGTSAGDAAEGGVASALSPLTSTTIAGAVSRKVRTFSGYLPYAIDRSSEDGKQLLNLSSKKFDLLDPGSLQGIYRSFKFSMGERAAQIAVGDVALAQAGGDVQAVKTAYLTGHKQMLIAAGLPDDHALVKQVMDKIDDAHADIKSEWYGVGHSTGHEVNDIQLTVPARVSDATGAFTTQVSVPAALWSHQASQLASYPDFWQVKNSLRAMTAAKNALGSADEFIANNYTNSIFKPLALVNAGFGLRVAAAEALPAAFRYGALNMLQNRVAASSAKSGYKIDQRTQVLLDKANAAREAGDQEGFLNYTKQAQDGDVGHVLATVAKLHGGMAKLLKVSDQDMDVATHIVNTGNGQAVWGVGRAGEGTHREARNAVDREAARLWYNGSRRAGTVKTGNYTLFNPSVDGYTDEWHGNLIRVAKEKPAQNIAQDLLTRHRQGLDPDTAAHEATVREANRIQGLHPTGTQRPTDVGHEYAAEQSLLIRYAKQDPYAFAGARVDSIRNLLTGHDGTFHEDLAQTVARGDEVTRDAVAAKPLTAAPRDVPGVSVAPLPPTSLYSELISRGFKTVVDPIINHLSREPLFLAAVKDELPALRQLQTRGLISEDEMYREAYYRATEAMLPQIHNVQLRSQFSALFRNILPFYFAQEQAVKRAGHLVGKNPGAFRDYQMIAHSLQDPNFVHTDASGNRSIVLPLAGGIGSHLLDGLAGMGMPVQSGLPLTFTGSTESLRTVLPELTTPGTSPLITVPLNEFAKYFPEWTPQVKAVVGDRGLGQSLKNELIPNQLIRNTLTAMSGDTQDRTMANAMSQALAAAAAHGQLPDANAAPAVQQAAIDRIKNNARSIVFMKGLVASFSPLSPTPVAEDFGVREEFQNLLDSGLTYPEAIQKFLAHHGSSYISYTVGKTSNTTGATINNTQEALDWITRNHAVVQNHMSAAYFTPEGTTKTSDLTLYNEELNMGLRSKQTPEDFLNQMYIKSGSQTYRNDKAIHDAAVASYTSPDDIKAENTQWSAHLEDLKKANVIWAADFTSESRDLRAIQLFSDMDHLFSTNQAPAGPQTALIGGLMSDFKLHLAALASPPQGVTKTAERDGWNSYLDTVETQHPELANVIDNVFRRADRRV